MLSFIKPYFPGTHLEKTVRSTPRVTCGTRARPTTTRNMVRPDHTTGRPGTNEPTVLAAPPREHMAITSGHQSTTHPISPRCASENNTIPIPARPFRAPAHADPFLLKSLSRSEFFLLRPLRFRSTADADAIFFLAPFPSPPPQPPARADWKKKEKGFRSSGEGKAFARRRESYGRIARRVMAEEPAVGYDGFEAAGDAGAGGAEDNLSMPLGDFMAFLETEPAPPEEGGEEEEEQEQLQPGVSCLSPCPNSLCVGFRDVGSDLLGWWGGV